MPEVKTIVWNTLTADTELQQLFGGTVRLYNIWAQPNAEFPYAVYRTGGTSEDNLLMQADLSIDIFAHSDNQETALEIARRMIQLLDRKYEDGHRFVLNSMFDVPEDERYVWHTNIVWSVRYTQEWRIGNAAGI